MVDPRLLEKLRCPQDGSPLTLAEPQLVQRLNRSVESRQLVNVGGHLLEKPLDSGLVRQTGDLLYPVIDRIPVMLPDEAIDLSQLESIQ